ncbi:beta-lactamase family protein [bacterium]|nr:beta-lactamase family protein [bacterium]
MHGKAARSRLRTIARLIRWGPPLLLTLVLLLLIQRQCTAGDQPLDKKRQAIGTLVLDAGNESIEVHGPLNREDAAPAAAADSFFHIGSNTKAMTATMLAMLVEEGLLDWDSTVAEVWPEQAADFDEQMRDVTLQDLLTHRSGMQAFTDGAEWKAVPARRGDARQRRREFSHWLLGQPPKLRRGKYLYSNADYGVASAMAEERSGQSWEQLMQERLFGPLGMDVQFGWPLDRDSAQPTGYYSGKGQLRAYGRAQGYVLPVEIAAAADLSMPLGEYAKFLRLHLDGLSGSPRLLSAESFAHLHEPAGHYACGWIVLDRDIETPQGSSTERISTHNGSTRTFYIHALINQTRGIAGAAVVNCGGDAARELTTTLVDGLLGGEDQTGSVQAAQPADPR